MEDNLKRTPQMMFSPSNINMIRRNICGGNKKECIKDLSSQIEKLEQEMYSDLNKAYLDIINKCSQLEDLEKKAVSIKAINHDLQSVNEDKFLRFKSSSEELLTIEKGLERVEKIEDELRLLIHFISLGNSVKDISGRIECVVYKTVKNIKEMQNQLLYFKKYNFQSALATIYISGLNSFLEFMSDSLNNWLTSIPFKKIGKLVNRFDFAPQLFDELSEIRSMIISLQFLELFYAANELNMIEKLVQMINSKRAEGGFDLDLKKLQYSISDDLDEQDDPDELIKSEINRTESLVSIFKKVSLSKNEYYQENLTVFQRNAKNPQETLLYYYYLITAIITSHFLAEILPDCKTFYVDIISKFDHVKFYQPEAVKIVILPLKRILTGLDIDSECLQGIIEKIIMNFLQTEYSGDDLESLINFVDKIMEFTKNSLQFSNELDEILAMKIDEILRRLFSKRQVFKITDSQRQREVYMEEKEKTNKVLAHLREKTAFFLTYNYKIERMFYDCERVFVDEKVKALLKAKNNINDVVKELISLKTFMDLEIRHRILKTIIPELNAFYKEDDLTLFHDTIRRQFDRFCME